MRPGEVDVQHVARRFVVRARETQTLKDLVVARGRTGAQEVWALRDVSLHVEPGEAVGLIGRNGSGKSTLLRLIARIIRPTGGRVAVGGRVGSLLELGAGFHPDFTGRENVFLNGSVHGLSRAQIRERFDEIVAFAELEDAIDRPVRTYSSGMYMRLGFGIAAHLDADTLLLDEVFAVGDEAFQRKCFGRIAEYKRGGGTIIFVSHDAAAVERLCERGVLLRRGELAFDGPAREAIVRYRSDLAAEPDPAAGSSQTGNGAAEIASAHLLDTAGAERTQFLAGEALVLSLQLVAREAIAAPRVHLELVDDAGFLVAEELVDVASLGWSSTPGGIGLRLEIPDPPLQFGRFHLRIGLIADDDRLLHQRDEALVFVVYPDGEGRGLVRLAGSWSSDAKQGVR